MKNSPIPIYQPELARTLNRWALIFSIITLLIIASLRRFHIDTEIDFSWLAIFHSMLNALTAVGLIMAYLFIRKKNISAHRNMMTINMILSALFLVSYVIYHLTTAEVKYCHTGGIRTIYFVLLITHVILAAVILPIVLFTYIRAFTGQIELHKKMARWAFPLWLYVAVTGPILYLMLRSCQA